jgi:hypothetical protein
MKLIRLITITLVIVLFGCGMVEAPVRNPFPENEVKVENLQIPSTINPGEEGYFSVETESKNLCKAKVGYFNEKQEWIIIEFQPMFADNNGNCEWIWIVPENVSSGLGVFWLNITKNNEIRYLPPMTFCYIECW